MTRPHTLSERLVHRRVHHDHGGRGCHPHRRRRDAHPVGQEPGRHRGEGGLGDLPYLEPLRGIMLTQPRYLITRIAELTPQRGAQPTQMTHHTTTIPA